MQDWIPVLGGEKKRLEDERRTQREETARDLTRCVFDWATKRERENINQRNERKEDDREVQGNCHCISEKWIAWLANMKPQQT